MGGLDLWSYKTQAWLGTYVIRSKDGGVTWTEPIPVNIRPMKHGGCRLGAWELPDGGLILALYGRMREYSEDGTGETNRCFLVRSDDGGDNWDYYGTLAYDPNNIIDYEEAGIVRLDDGRLVSFMRTHLQPSQDTKSMIMVVSEDDGFTWSQPKWTRIWGYPPELIRLQDGRYLLVYGYRRPSYGVRGIISDNGIDWDVGNEFVISEGGIPATSQVAKPSSSRVVPVAGLYDEGAVNYFHPGLYQHIGYPTVTQAADGTVVCSYHEWSQDERPLQILKCARFEI
ncbi:MAG: sialidase family protein [bacterium]|nr:sialidase family protein [bacterium]